jgi:hypothetical protein
MHSQTRWSTGAAAVIAVFALSSCGSVGDLDVDPRDDSRKFEFSGERLTVDSGSNVRIEAGDGPDLTVSRKLTGMAAEEGNASWNLEGSTLRLTAKCSGLVLNCGSSYTVKVPSGTAVSVVTTGADVTAAGLADELTVRTKSGRIKASGGSGPLRLTSGTGRITVSDSNSPDVVVRSHDAAHFLSFRKAPRRVSAHLDIGDISLTLPKDGTRYAIEGRAQEKDKYRVGVPNSPGASNRISVESPQGRVRVEQKN